MTNDEISSLIYNGSFPCECTKPELVETHISWVIICNEFVFKIKKPISYSFLDFSTLERRLHFCKREMQLNQRLALNMYLEALPLRKTPKGFTIGKSDGEIVDYAIQMRKQDRERQMDILLQKNKVTHEDIKNLAEVIARFHRQISVIKDADPLGIKQKFNDLAGELSYLNEALGDYCAGIINHAIDKSNHFIEMNKDLLQSRLTNGFFRDGHGDLHSRNIFLLPEPVIFDCIEFNDEYRQIDVLNEVAFLCMDLDAAEKHDLSDLFITHYNKLLPTMRTENERQLFNYYKGYRANVRAKVNSLRARSSQNDQQQKKALREVEKYLWLMDSCIKLL